MEDELKKQARQLGLQEQIVFEGFVKNVDKKIRESNIFVLCSNYEGVSNSMVEAMALGLPVIATDCPIGGCKSYIENEKNGLLIPVGDKEELVKALKRVAENDDFAASLSKNAIKVREDYSIKQIGNLMLSAANMWY